MTEDEWHELENAVAASAPDRHVAAFFAPAQRRRALVALYAFDNELAHVAGVVREPMLGHVRLAWWRQRLAAIYEGAAQQAPTAKALAKVVDAHKPPRALLDGLIDARAHDFDEAPFADEAAFERYADATEGNVMRLAVHILGLAPLNEEVIRNVALAAALGTQQSNAPRLARQRRYRLPLTWLQAQGMNTEDIFANPDAVARVMPQATQRIDQALATANRGRFRLGAMPVLSPATMARETGPAAPWRRFARIAFANLTWRL